LARQQGILRDICIPRVFVQGQYEQPRDADNNEQRGEVRGDLEDAGIPAERQ
jgi:hypothetical protein